MGQGLSNKEIADRLFIDERTVEGHVRDVLSRLGLRRGQVIAWLAHAGDAAEVPRPPGNLPLENSSFIGRERELEGLGKLLERSRLLTITGIGGVGKTRAALRLASRLHHQFPGGAWLIDLSEIGDGPGVEAAIASSMPIEPTARTLVVLDCCEPVLSAAAEAAGRLLTNPSINVIATSRQSLGVAGEAVYPMAPMSEADALRLLEDRAATAAPQTDLASADSDLRAICARLGGIPLAIELVAPRLRAMSAADLAAALALELGEVLTRSGAPGRHGSVEATIAWSYDSLLEPEQRLFRRLGVASGPVSFEDVVALAGDGWTPPAVLSALLGLVEKSLIGVESEVRGTHYRLLDPVREFARRRLVEAGELESAETTRARHFTALAERAAGELGRRPSRVRAATRAIGRHPVRALAGLAIVLAGSTLSYVVAQPPPAAIVTTVALTAGGNASYDMAFGPDGSLYFADGPGSIHRLTPAGKMSALPAPAGLLDTPTAVQVAKDGTVYVADFGHERVRALKNGSWETVCGPGIRSEALTSSTYDDPLSARGPMKSLVLAPDGRLFGSFNMNDFRPGIAYCPTAGLFELTLPGPLTLYTPPTCGFSGDGSWVANAAFEGPDGVALDAAGDLYVADSGNNRVRRIDALGVVSTVAGNGSPGHAGDGGPAVHAELDRPVAVAVDAEGNLYIGDLGDSRIRKVDTHGVISTVAGNGQSGFGGDGGPAMQATFGAPEAMAFDRAGNLYVDDVFNKRIRKITFRT